MTFTLMADTLTSTSLVLLYGFSTVFQCVELPFQGLLYHTHSYISEMEDKQKLTTENSVAWMQASKFSMPNLMITNLMIILKVICSFKSVPAIPSQTGQIISLHILPCYHYY